MQVEVEKAGREYYDLCIVGAGPAGIILALEYQQLQPEKRVLLIEYGKEGIPTRNRLDDSIKVMETRNHHLPYDCTNKGVGGSSATWGGRCVMYDEIDFTPRKIVDGQCTWDISLFHESRRYGKQAARYFECGDATFNLNEIPAFADSAHRGRVSEWRSHGFRHRTVEHADTFRAALSAQLEKSAHWIC